MKNIELRKVPCGETFTVFGEEYVVLDHVDGGVLSIRKEIWKKAVFDRSGNNNLSEADILQVLSEYGELLKSRGAKAGDLHSQRVDLKATDGTRVYGYLDCTVALLTLEQYGKYKEIIPKADDWWWLATPVWTRWLRSPYTYDARSVWGVDSGGDYYYWGANDSLGVRPVLTFNSCLLVSWQDEESQGTTGEEAQKEKRWDAYIKYLNDWADDHSGAECYGAAPLGFDEWLEEEYDWSKEDEGDDE